jgi:PAS domain S-box-containing protein
LITDKPTYEELELRGKALEKKAVELRRAAEDLRASEEEWRSLVKNAPNLIFIVDREGIIQYINHTVPGLEIEKVIGTRQYDYVLPEYHKVMRECIEHVFKTGQNTSYEIAGVGPDGSTSWYMTKVGPIKRNGEVVAVTIMPTDITERKRTEEALQHSEEMYRRLVETMNDGLGIIDKNAVITYVNNRTCEMLRYSRDEIIGHPVTDFLDDANQKILKEQIVRRRKGERGSYEIVWTGKDRRKVCTIVSSQPVFDDEGRFEGSFGVLTDITDRNLAEVALRERETALEIQAEELQEVNTALRVLLRQRDKDKTELEEKVFLNVRELVTPQVEKLKKTISDAKQKAYLSVLESNLNEIISPFAHRLSSKYSALTPTEIQMAFLVRDGKTTKEIAEQLNLSDRTVESHRQSIRMKMGIRNRRANLRSHLLSMKNN